MFRHRISRQRSAKNIGRIGVAAEVVQSFDSARSTAHTSAITCAPAVMDHCVHLRRRTLRGAQRTTRNSVAAVARRARLAAATPRSRRGDGIVRPVCSMATPNDGPPTERVLGSSRQRHAAVRKLRRYHRATAVVCCRRNVTYLTQARRHPRRPRQTRPRRSESTGERVCTAAHSFVVGSGTVPRRFSRAHARLKSENAASINRDPVLSPFASTRSSSSQSWRN